MICEKCQQSFDLESRKPMVLHCGHSMCLLCLEEKQTEACPSCSCVIKIINVNWQCLRVIREESQRINKNMLRFIQFFGDSNIPDTEKVNFLDFLVSKCNISE